MSITRTEKPRTEARPSRLRGGRYFDDDWKPQPIGPRFERPAAGRIRLLEGRLAGREFDFNALVERHAASAEFVESGATVARALVERPTGRNILWDLGVRPALRGCGLAAILATLVFRRLLAEPRPAHYSIRMVRSLNAGNHATEVQNAGMTVIAHQLGFTPNASIGRIIAPGNIVGAEVLEARNGNPPGLLLFLKTAPLALVCLALDPKTQRPTADTRVYLHLVNRPEALGAWFDRKALAVSDGDYSLRIDGRPVFIRRLAGNAIQAVEYSGAVLAD